MSGDYEIVMDRTASFLRTFKWKINDVPVDVTRYDALLLVKPDYDEGDPILTLSTANGQITMDADGDITCRAPYSQTKDLRPGLYVYDLFTKDEFNVYKLLTGRWRVQPSVTALEGNA